MLFSLLATAGVASAFPWGSGNGGFGSHGGNTGPSFSGSHGGNTGPSFSGSHGGNSGSPFSGSHGSAASSGSNGFPAFVPPGEGDVRSPCPALNTLANHGYLPHSGKGITTDDIIKGFMAGQNFAADTVTGAAAGALALCSRETGTNCTSWDLDMLDKPHEIEHDNSLSREDYNYGQDNNTVFSNRVWNQVLGIWRGARIIDFKLATAAITERVAVTSRFDAPGWYVNATGASFHETAFYISLFGDPVEGNARQDWINVWFEQERMPFELDWTPTQRQTITEASLDAMVEKLEAAQTGFGSGTHFAHSRTNTWWKFGGN